MEKLKYFSFVLLMVLCAGFTSCSDDDDEEGSGNVSIVGAWQKESNAGSVYHFNANGKLSSYLFSSDYATATAEVSTWELSGNTLCLFGDEYYQVQELSGDRLTLKSEYSDKVNTYTRISTEKWESIISGCDVNVVYNDFD